MDCVIWEANSNNLQDGFHVRHPKHRNQHSSFVDPTITSKVFLLWVTIRDIEEASSKYISRLRSPYPINTESFFHQRLTGTSRSLPPSEKKIWNPSSYPLTVFYTLCQNCQVYGHNAGKSRNPEACVHWGGDHNHTNCSKPISPICVFRLVESFDTFLMNKMISFTSHFLFHC